jgi:hypothetical protein
MDYNYDVFVSYKRSEEWNDWVSHKFIPMLRRHLLIGHYTALLKAKRKTGPEIRALLESLERSAPTRGTSA